MSKHKSCYLISIILEYIFDIGNFNNIKDHVALLKLRDFSVNRQEILQYLVIKQTDLKMGWGRQVYSVNAGRSNFLFFPFIKFLNFGAKGVFF